MKAWLLDKISYWFVAAFDWWTPNPEERWAQIQEAHEAEAELHQALTELRQELMEVFGLDRLAAWLAEWLDRLTGTRER